jgi:hypothetical protein
MIARTIGFVALLLPSLALAETDFWISHDKINLEDSQSVARLDTSFRISARHSVQFSYIDLSRDGDNVTSRPLLISDTLYSVVATSTLTSITGYIN